MRIVSKAWCGALLLASLALAQQPSSSAKTGEETGAKSSPSDAKLEKLLEGNIKTEWDAFKNKDKKAYGELLADDFVAVEDDSQGMRPKWAVLSEIDNSVVNNYSLFALKVIPLAPNVALVSYEITLQFPPKAQVRFKRVLVSEIWLKRDGEWKERYYQETKVK
jgi:hypothetical protein